MPLPIIGNNFAANNLIYGLPRRGLVSLIVPGWDVRCRNIMPVGSDNFVTGWSAYGGEVITITDYPVNIPGIGDVIAKRITGNGLGSSGQKYLMQLYGYANPHDHTCSVYAMKLSGDASVNLRGLDNKVITSTMQRLSCSGSVAATFSTIRFETSLATNIIDIVVYQPKMEFGFVPTPYSLALDLPQSTFDYSNHGNAFQLGSAAGADTNDPTYNAQGLTYGPQAFIKSASAVFDDMLGNSTTICALKAPTINAGYSSRIWDKGTKLFALNASDNKLRTLNTRSTGSDNTVTSNALTGGTNYIVSALQYGLGIPTDFYIGATKQAPTLSGGGGGSYNPDAATDLFVSNSAAATDSLLSDIYAIAFYNRTVTVSEAQQSIRAIQRLVASLGVTIAI